MRVSLCLMTLMCPLLVFAQNVGKINIKGTIVDAGDQQAIPYAQIASFEAGMIFPCNENGKFNITLNVTDSIRILSMGYAPVVIAFEGKDPLTFQNIEIKLSKTPFQLKEVNIRKRTANEHLSQFMPPDIKLGQKSDVPIGLRSDFGGKPNIINAVMMPTEFLYYHLSSAEKDKRGMLKLQQEEERKDILSKELMSEITGFEGEELNDFIVYCNINIKIDHKETGESIRRKIIDAAATFKNKATKTDLQP